MNNKQVIEDLGARFENTKALHFTIGNLLENLENTNNLGLLKMEIREIINLSFVVDTLNLQIDELLSKLYNV